MSEYYGVEINGTFLTDSGLADGDPYRLEIPNIEDLLLDRTGKTFTSIKGNGIVQTRTLKGLPVTITVKSMYLSVYLLVKAHINDCLNSGATLTLTITGPEGSKTFNVAPVMPGAIKYESFSGDWVEKVTIKLQTT